MAKNSTAVATTADAQPDELGELKVLVQDYVSRLQTIENEIELLKEDKKALNEEFSTKLDTKTLQSAQRIVKIKTDVKHPHTLDVFLDILEGPGGE